MPTKIVETYRDYLANKPGDRFAMYSLALALSKAGDKAGAELAFRELLALHPTSGAGHLQHGRLLADLGRTEDAKAALQAGIDALREQLDPESKRSLAELRAELEGIE